MLPEPVKFKEFPPEIVNLRIPQIHVQVYQQSIEHWRNIKPISEKLKELDAQQNQIASTPEDEPLLPLKINRQRPRTNYMRNRKRIIIGNNEKN